MFRVIGPKLRAGLRIHAEEVTLAGGNAKDQAIREDRSLILVGGAGFLPELTGREAVFFLFDLEGVNAAAGSFLWGADR